MLLTVSQGPPIGCYSETARQHFFVTLGLVHRPANQGQIRKLYWHHLFRSEPLREGN
jgi:hypothetical protein